MISHEKLLVRLTIHVQVGDPKLCNASSSGQGIDGCDSFHYDADGEAFCGAFGESLARHDEDDNGEFDPHRRCKPCLESEVP